MSDGEVRGIVVAHSELARALITAVESIAGTTEGALVPLSNDGLGPEAIRERLDELAGDGPAIVFADLREGSCGLAARAVCMGDGPRRALVTGVNLPVLLDFVMKRHLPLDDLVARLVERGRAAITSAPEPRR
jgi:mannose/fructose-specific phosphotransferase system component IIA